MSEKDPNGVDNGINKKKLPKVELSTKQKWWEKKKAHLSRDNKYYVVPLSFNNFTNNENITKYSTTDGVTKGNKYVIGESGVTGLLGVPDFVEFCKLEALKKLGTDLNKALQFNKLSEWSKDHAIIPKNKMVKKGTASIVTVQAWNIVPRRPDYQNLQIKVLFYRDWVNSLPNKTNPDIDYSVTNREVMIPIKDLKQYLNNLELVLRHFDVQMQLALANSGVETSFDAICTADRLTKVYDILNGLLVFNKKGDLEDFKDTKAALQFGFTKDYILQYIAFSEEPDCLCDKDVNMNAYALKEGLNEVKGAPPFNSQTINNFIHLLPDINRKYSKYLPGTNTGAAASALFGTEQSWLNFLNTYVYPQPDVHHHGRPGKMDATESGWGQLYGGLNMLSKNPLLKDALSGKYIKDPLQLMSPEIKGTVVAASNITNMYYGDDAMLKALFSELKSMTSLYDKLLNKIPISELVKIAGTLIFKCLPLGDFKKKMCKIILKTLPIAEIRNTLYPCLRRLGVDGELAIASLEGKITGRTGDVYKIAAARYPDKFPPGEEASDAAIAEMTSLFCSDPHMQNKLGRSPDDFNDELAAWADDKASAAVCDCIMTLFNPVGQLVDIANDVYGEVTEGLALLRKGKKAYNLEQENTLALDKMLAPIKVHLKSRAAMADFGKAFAQGLQDMAMGILYSAVMIVLKYVKEGVLGSLTADLCNASSESPFNFSSPKDWIMNSPVYKDKGQQQLWDKMGDFKLKNAWNLDIQSMANGFEKLGEIYSPSELKLLFTTPCSDNSRDDLFEQALPAWVSPETLSAMEEEFPGLTPSEIVAKADSKSTYKAKNAAGDDIVKNFPDDWVTPGQIHELLNEMGKFIPPSVYDEAIDQYELLKDQFAAFCDPDVLDELAKTIDPDDIKNLAAGNIEELLDDIETMFPLLNKEMMQDMYPPLFCGPCSPNQVGMKPIMSSQFHPTQLFMSDRSNEETYKLIDNVFNNNLSNFKPIINEEENTASQFFDKLLNKATEIGAVDNFSEATEKADNMWATAAEDSKNKMDSNPKQWTAEKFRENLDILTQPHLHNIDPITADSKTFVVYEIPDSIKSLHLVFNFSENNMTYLGNNVLPSQIKLYIYSLGIKEYEYPGYPENTQLKAFNLDDVSENAFNYFTENENASDSLTSVTDSTNLKGIVKAILPIATAFIFETVWKNTSKGELFSYQNFNLLPLTNSEVRSSCAAGSADSATLLDIPTVVEQISESARALECVISIFDTPDALQISTLNGLFRLLIKVCVVEEYLKNIFIFGSLAKISDIIEHPSYLSYVERNVAQAAQAALPESYDILKEHCAKIVNGKSQLADEDPSATEEEKKEAFRVKTPEEAIRMYIKEVALELDKIFDSRVQEFINPEWKDQFISEYVFEDAKKQSTYFINDYLKYAVSSSPSLTTSYPLKDTASDLNQYPFFVPSEPQNGSFTKGADGFLANVFIQPGLKFEPYIRMNSVFKDQAVHTGPGIASSAELYTKQSDLASFITVFEASWKQFSPRTKTFGRLSFDVQNNPKNPYTNASSPRKSLPLLDATENDILQFSKWMDTYVSLVSQFKTKGLLFEDNEPGMPQLYSAANDPSMDPLFMSFFKLFRPLLDDGTPKSDTLGDAFSVLEKTVSSFQKTGVPTQHPGIDFEDSDVEFGNGSLEEGVRWKDSFFYWQAYPKGIAYESQLHWRNRGVIGAALAGYKAWSPVPWPYRLASNDTFEYRYSTIAVYARSKETSLENFPSEKASHGVGESGYESFVPYDEPIPTIESPDTTNKYDKGEWSKDRQYNTVNTSVLFQVQKFLKELSISANWTGDDDPFVNEDDFYEIWKEEESSKLGGGTVVDKDKIISPYFSRKLTLFYEFLKTIIIDSPYDMWFDISIGMRLNLIIPTAGLAEEQLTELLETQALYQGSIGHPLLDNKYNLDKTLLLKNTAALNAKKFLCLPIEFVEYDLKDYWESIFEKGNANKTMNDEVGPFPGISSFEVLDKKELDDAAKANPWHPIMENILILGTEPEFDFIRGLHPLTKVWQPNSFYQYPIHEPAETLRTVNYQKNMHCPFTANGAVAGGYESNSQSNNFDRPTLWSACKLINIAFAHFDAIAAIQSPNKTAHMPISYNTNKKMLASLQSNLFKKMAEKETKSGTVLFQEVLPIRESIFTTALVFRELMEHSYPQLSDMFLPTKSYISSFIVKMIKAFDGNYDHVDDITKSTNDSEKLSASGADPAQIAWQFFLMAVQLSATTVDPTWKTPWFLPGPLTPIGIVAKTISGDSSDDDDSDKDNSAAKEVCDEPKGYGKKPEE